MKNRNPNSPAPPRRAFISSAALSLTTFVAGAIAGCRQEDVAPNAADDAELASLRRVDPKFIAYHETGNVRPEMEEPRSITAVPDGTFWLVGDNTLQSYGRDGSRRVSLSLEGAPVCVAPGPDRTLTVGMRDHVEVYRQDGRRMAVWPSLGERAQITAIAWDKDTFWIANAADRVVLRSDYRGNILARIGEKDSAAGYSGLIIPSPHLDVAPAPGGKVYVTNPGMHRVETHTPDGKFESAWGTASSTLDAFCGCCNPTDFALLPDGRFVTAEKGIPRVKVYSAAGQFESVVAGPEAFASNVLSLDIAVAPDGRVLALDPRAKTVHIFTRLSERKG